MHFQPRNKGATLQGPDLEYKSLRL